MAYREPSRDELVRLLETARTIAVVGASSDPARPSHGVFVRLLRAGYRVIPVNPSETAVLGQTAVARLDQIEEPIDIVDVFRRAEATPDVARAAVAVGAKALWLQSGISNEETAARATTGGLVVVMNACIGVMHSMLRVPKK